MDDGWCKPATKVMKEVPCPPTLSASTTPVDAFSTRQGPEHEKHEKDWGYAIMLSTLPLPPFRPFVRLVERYSLLVVGGASVGPLCSFRPCPYYCTFCTVNRIL